MKKTTKKIKFGATSLAMTAVIIAAVIVINAVFTQLASSMLWYFDMTGAKVFTLSDECRELLSDVDEEVNIYFAQPTDKLMSGEDSNEYMKYIYTTALQLEKAFDNIHVKCVDVIKNPAFFEYYYNTAASNIKTTSVIVESGGEFRLFSSDAFYYYDEDYTYIWAYDGEAKFAAAILQVTASSLPTVYFTTGHGESESESSAVWKLYETAGFNVEEIDLTKDEISDDGRIIVINNPIYDFSGIEVGEENEISKLDRFVDDYGCLMVFVDSENAGNLTNISEYLEEWGVKLNPGVTIRDTENSISRDGRDIVAKYETESTLGQSLYSDITKLSSMPKTVLYDAMPITLTYDEADKLMGSKLTSAVLYSNDTSELFENGEAGEKGSYPIVTISREEGIKDNDYFHSYVFVCSSPEFISDKYINSNSYANSDIILSAARLIGREKIVADIDIKVFDDTSLDVTAAVANRWTVALTLIPATVAAIVGITVCIRRRRK